MFEIGKNYQIKMISLEMEGETETTSVWSVVKHEGTLIKLQNPHSKDLVVNTASAHFVSAEKV